MEVSRGIPVPTKKMGRMFGAYKGAVVFLQSFTRGVFQNYGNITWEWFIFNRKPMDLGIPNLETFLQVQPFNHENLRSLWKKRD